MTISLRQRRSLVSRCFLIVHYINVKLMRMMSKKLCIVNGLSLVPPLTGVGRVTLELCRRLYGEDSDFKPLYWYGYYASRLWDEESAGGEGVPSWYRRCAGAVRRVPGLRRVVRKVLYVAGNLRCRRADLYWEPNHVVMDALRAPRTLVTVHDLSCLLYPQWHPRERLDFFNAYFIKGLRRADHIVTVSETVRGEVLEHLRLPGCRVSSIPNGVNLDHFIPLSPDAVQRFRESRRLPERFVLCVGSIEPRKNLTRLIEAWDRLPPKLRNGCKLLLLGGSGWENTDIMRAIHDSADVHWVGYVPYGELPYYYNAAELFVYPSLYEGFGLPPLEAMACGTPVLVSDIPVHREVCSDVAAYVSPWDSAQMAEVLEALLDARRRTEGLRDRASRFDWGASAKGYARLMGALVK